MFKLALELLLGRYIWQSIMILDAPYAVAVVSLTLFSFEGMQVGNSYLLKYISDYDNIAIPDVP